MWHNRSVWVYVCLCAFGVPRRVDLAKPNDVRKLSRKERRGESVHEGNCFKNCFEIFCEPIPPSWFDFRQYADEDDSADRFAEHMRKRGLLLQEQDPEIAKKETEKRLAEFTEDLEKVKEKIAYKQNLELSEQALLEEGKSREEEGIGMKMKNALVNVFGNNSIGTKTFKEKRKTSTKGKKEITKTETTTTKTTRSWEVSNLRSFSTKTTSQTFFANSKARTRTAEAKPRSAREEDLPTSTNANGGSNKRKNERTKVVERKERQTTTINKARRTTMTTQRKKKKMMMIATTTALPRSPIRKKPIDERDTEADNEDRSGTSSSEDDVSSSSSFSSSSEHSNNTSISTGSSSLSSGGSVDDDDNEREISSFS